uniref:Uncharacterized protein n=1 Tax=Caenorhabditis japonica TaxID=281687 RepID=A0A8R1HWW1_CAEJA
MVQTDFRPISLTSKLCRIVKAIAPFDYHLFRPLKLFLKEKRFAKYEDLTMAVFDFFDSQSAAFWKKGIGDLPERWLTVVTNDGQYIVD